MSATLPVQGALWLAACVGFRAPTKQSLSCHGTQTGYPASAHRFSQCPPTQRCVPHLLCCSASSDSSHAESSSLAVLSGLAAEVHSIQKMAREEHERLLLAALTAGQGRSSQTTGQATAPQLEEHPISSSGCPCDQPGGTPVAPLKQRVANTLRWMGRGLVEREVEVRLLLLAALSGEHVLFIGAPGTAKSLLSRRLADICHGTFFERLLTRFSVPEELFGPLSMRALEYDRYQRQVSGFLPDAHVAFIDEIFKANSAILNTLLTIMNERLFDQGAERIPVPLRCLVAASNELPESEELDALYDRFLVRREVSQVSPAGLVQLLMDANRMTGGGDDVIPGRQLDEHPQLVTLDDLQHVREAAVASVSVPDDVIQLITALRDHLQDRFEPPLYVSDRRITKALQLLQVVAYVDARAAVEQYDVLLLQHVLWSGLGQATRISDWIVDRIAFDDGSKQMELRVQALFTRTCKSQDDVAALHDISGQLSTLQHDITTRLQGIPQALESGVEVPFFGSIWLSLDDQEALQSVMMPKFEKSNELLRVLLLDVVTLQVSVHRQAGRGCLSQLLPRYWSEFIRTHPMAAVKQRLVGALYAEQNAQYFRRPYI